ncbi:MAG: carboxypeptidase regulatory-like domain-containing protein [Nitrospiria bacterium]
MKKVRVLERSFLMSGFFLILFSVLTSPSNLLAYEMITVNHGGELSGTIKYKGDPPVNPSHQVANNPDFCGSTVQEETFLVNSENKGLENVVISIEDIQRGKKPLSSNVVIENRHCHFIPHVQGAMVGDSYEIRNSDPVLHNTHLHFEESTLVNVAMPPGGKNIRKSFLQAGVINVKCDAHKFMQGWIPVMDNPYFAVTDKEGNYKISGIPPGKYKIKIWHEGLDGTEKEVTISPDKKTELTLDLTHR